MVQGKTNREHNLWKVGGELVMVSMNQALLDKLNGKTVISRSLQNSKILTFTLLIKSTNVQINHVILSYQSGHILRYTMFGGDLSVWLGWDKSLDPLAG